MNFYRITLLLGSAGLVLSYSIFPAKANLYKDARCQAFCISNYLGNKTGNAKGSNEDYDNCLSGGCKSGSKMPLNECLVKCGNSTACKLGCSFFHNIPSNESAYTERIVEPGQPVVINKNFSTILLSWRQPKNITNGTLMYVIEMSYGGDLSSGWEAKMITHDTTALVRELHLCLTIRDFYDVNFGRRDSYDGIHYKFRVVALTEYSSKSTGNSSGDIELPRPQPVQNASFEIAGYFENSPGNKVKIRGTWEPSGSTDASQYFIQSQFEWKSCGHYLSPTSSKTYSSLVDIDIYQEQKTGCKNTFKVYALAGCSVSHATTVAFVNPGCQKIKDFPRDTCCRLDPPKAEQPEDLAVGNLTSSPPRVSSDFRFAFDVTWEPPSYVAKTSCNNLQYYRYRHGDINYIPTSCFPPPCTWGKFNAKSKDTTLATFTEIKPGVFYSFEITPYFTHGSGLRGQKRRINMTTPSPDPSDLKVRHLTVGGFVEASYGTLTVDVSWEKPVFNFSSISNYSVKFFNSYSKDAERKMKTLHIHIPNRRYGEKLHIKVVPVYLHDWIKGIPLVINVTAPVPESKDLIVRDLDIDRTNKDSELGCRYDVTFTWKKPSFILDRILYYKTSARTSRHREGVGPTNTTNEEIALQDLIASEGITFEVTPVYDSPFVSGTMSRITREVPSLTEEEAETILTVRNLRMDRFFIYSEMKTSNISWDPPFDRCSAVLRYFIQYEISNGNIATYTVYTTATTLQLNLTLDEMLVYFKVTPVFTLQTLRGISKRLEATTATSEQPSVPNSSEGLSTATIAGLTAGILFLVAVVVVITLPLLRESKRKREQEHILHNMNPQEVSHECGQRCDLTAL